MSSRDRKRAPERKKVQREIAAELETASDEQIVALQRGIKREITSYVREARSIARLTAIRDTLRAG